MYVRTYISALSLLGAPVVSPLRGDKLASNVQAASFVWEKSPLCLPEGVGRRIDLITHARKRA